MRALAHAADVQGVLAAEDEDWLLEEILRVAPPVAGVTPDDRLGPPLARMLWRGVAWDL